MREWEASLLKLNGVSDGGGVAQQATFDLVKQDEELVAEQGLIYSIPNLKERKSFRI